MATPAQMADENVWFFQAIAASPAMFRRAPGAGSLYWLGHRDSTGSYLDGARPADRSRPTRTTPSSARCSDRG